jgi:hypothetical protein
MKDELKTWDIYFSGAGFGYCFGAAVEWKCWIVERADRFFSFGPFSVTWHKLSTTHTHRWYFSAGFGTVERKGHPWKWWQKLFRIYG